VEINLKVNPETVERIATSLERLAHIFEVVYAPELKAASLTPDEMQAEIKHFYQSDRDLYEQELKEKQESIQI